MPVRSKIPALRAQLRPATARGVARAAGYVADLARQLAPVDEGDLRDSIQVEPTGPDLKMAVTAGRGLPDPRAILNEYGGDSIFYPAQPYMTPAAEAIDVAREVKAELRALIKRSRAR